MLKFAIAAIVSATPALAVAHDDPTPPQVRIATADLDLSGDAGQAALRRRVRDAVVRVCPATRELDVTMACRREAMDGVSAQVETVTRLAAVRPAATEIAYRK